MTRLRGLKPTQPIRMFKPDFHYKEFGKAHNIVANEATQTVFVVGATHPNYPTKCKGMLLLAFSTGGVTVYYSSKWFQIPVFLYL